MADDDDSWEEGEALDVVLTLDQDPLEVDQYEVTDFDAEEPEKIGFMESSSPELHDTVDHEPVEIHADDVGEEIKNVPKLEFTKTDPFDEVPEPVHQGKGTVFSPSQPSKVDDDLLGHVGGSELPSLPPDELYENKIDFTVKKASTYSLQSYFLVCQRLNLLRHLRSNYLNRFLSRLLNKPKVSKQLRLNLFRNQFKRL